MGIPAIMPDCFGYGVSNAQIYKAYVIRQSYETSIVPIWYTAARILREESDCQTELANELTLTGYSEGGYAGPLIATALHTLGWNIIKVHAGAAPARVGSALMPGLLQVSLWVSTRQHMQTFFMLLGSSYSSTYRDVAGTKHAPTTKQELLPPLSTLLTTTRRRRAPTRKMLLKNFTKKSKKSLKN
jgi:hypothetical protein